MRYPNRVDRKIKIFNEYKKGEKGQLLFVGG
ncbi:MAG: hypothetical protein H6Q26_185 [Bacteroidetes bacterium]|nr:hypothetical protein [Bacteroidota bacterium]